jgi:uncharacterized protein YajQ (UPF0234 family)
MTLYSVHMADSSFDVVSKVDKMEADNALNQASKEIETRYDFKGVGASIEWSGEKILLKASAEERVKAVLEVFEAKLIKRGISLKSLESGDCHQERQASAAPNEAVHSFVAEMYPIGASNQT